jgi:hypothetical protein
MNNTLDQFYTNEAVALKYYNILKQKVEINSYDIFLEPSAGQGAFYKLMPTQKREGVDLDPKYPGVEQMNFFDYTPKPNKKYIVIGNPPFGRKCSMAKKFFNYAATFADTIAFIIPRTFKRNSVQNALNMNFELIFSEDTGKDCFTPSVSAKCCFQIWQRTTNCRVPVVRKLEHPDFTFLKEEERLTADFAIVKTGGSPGKMVYSNFELLHPQTYHYIKSNTNIEKNELIERFKGLNYTLAVDTCCQNSMGKSDLIYLYEAKYSETETENKAKELKKK